MKSNKVMAWVLTGAVLTIIIFTVFRMDQIKENHQRTLTEIDECIQINGVLEVITQTGIFSSSSTVNCE